MRFHSRRIWFGFLTLPISLGFWMWRAASWRPKIVRVSPAPVLALNWSKDGKTLRYATGDGQIQTLSSSSLETLSSSGRPAHWLFAQFSNNGLLLSANSDEVRLLNCASSRTIWTRSYAKDHTQNLMFEPEFRSIALSPQGDKLAFGVAQGNHGYSCALNIRGSKFVGNEQYFAGDGADALNFSADGALLAFGGAAAGTGVWDCKTGHSLWQDASESDIITLCFSPDAHQLALSTYQKQTWLLRSRDGKRMRILGVISSRCLTFSPDSTLLAGDDGNAINVWNVSAGALISHNPCGAPQVASLAFSPDSSRLAVGTSNGQVQLWRVR